MNPLYHLVAQGPEAGSGRKAQPRRAHRRPQRASMTAPYTPRMSLIDPYPLIAPSALRPVGQSPYWTPGHTVTWTFRRFDFDRDLAEVTRPMRVIADGPDGAVLWLPGGTPTGETRIVGWEDANPHDVPLRARFRPLAEAPTRIQVDGT